MRDRPTRPFAPRPLAFPGSGLADESIEEERPSLFFWGRERHLWIQVAAFVLFSAVLHGAGFYLFRVVYPPPLRYDSAPDTVSIIDRADPAGRERLREVRDRTVYLSPPSAEWLASSKSARLLDFEIRFAPSFPQVDTEILEARFPWSLPPSADAAPLLPPQAGEGLSVDGGAGSGLVLGGGLEALTLAPWSILEAYVIHAGAIPRLRLHLTASPSGDVAVESVSPELDVEDRDALVGLVEGTLRFLPAESGASGWIEFGGEETERSPQVSGESPPGPPEPNP